MQSDRSIVYRFLLAFFVFNAAMALAGVARIGQLMHRSAGMAGQWRSNPADHAGVCGRGGADGVHRPANAGAAEMRLQ